MFGLFDNRRSFSNVTQFFDHGLEPLWYFFYTTLIALTQLSLVLFSFCNVFSLLTYFFPSLLFTFNKNNKF